MKAGDVPNSKPRVHVLAARIPGQITPEVSEPAKEMFEDALKTPAWPIISDLLVQLNIVGIDVSDEKVARAVLEHAERELEAIDRASVRKFAHDPIVYYMGLGNLTKIGTSRNLSRRVENLNPQCIRAIEWGNHADERSRHAAFHGLHVHGEWFRHEDPLETYVDMVAAAFETDFGMTLDEWLATHRVLLRT